jgi:flagellar secretion chaperone FliS
VQSSIRDNYLETEVMTATPQKLQLMLLDAAIRNLNRGKQLWSEDKKDEACEVLIRAQEIVTQILAGLDREIDADLTQKVASVYMFVFRTLNEALMEQDEAKLDDCLRILEVERETWRQLCQKIEEEQPSENAAARATLSAPSAVIDPSMQAPPMPSLDLSAGTGGEEAPSSGFSIEA